MVDDMGSFTNQDKSSSSWQRFGLIRDPFSNDAEDIFAITQWQENLDLLQHLSANSNVMLAVTGKMNSGKTTLLNEFLNWHSEGMRTHYLDGGPRLDLEQLSHQLSEGFALPSYAADVPAVQKIPAQFKKLQIGKQKYLLIVDDAEQLPSDTLQVLLEMISRQSVSKANLHVMLFGLPELNKRLQNIAEEIDAKEFLHHIEIKPLNRKDAHRYIEHLFVSAGLKGKFPFTDAEFSRIYKLSEGYPGRINQVAKQTLLDKQHSKPSSCKISQIKTSTSNRPYTLAGLAAVCVLSAVGFTKFHETSTVGKMVSKVIPTKVVASSNVAPQPTQKVHQAVKLAEFVSDAVEFVRPPAQQLASNEHEEVLQQMIAQPKPAHVSAVKSNNDATRLAQNTTTTVKQHVLEPTPNKPGEVAETFISFDQIKEDGSVPVKDDNLNIHVDDELLNEHDHLDHHSHLKAINPDVVGRQATSSRTLSSDYEVASSEPSDKNEITIDLATNSVTYSKASSVNSKIAARKNTHRVTQADSKPTAKTKNHVNNAEAKILAIKSDMFAIQLMGSEDKEVIEQFIQENDLQAKARYFKTQLNGEAYYVVIYGKYKNAQLAAKAIKRLPQTARKDHPWVRRYAAIQKAILTQNEV